MDEQFINLTVQIVAAHVSNNLVAPQQLPGFIREAHQALATAGQTATAAQKPEPAVAVKKSVFADHIVCLDCGGSFRLLKRHLAAVHEMAPEEYRRKWGLPPSYPVVAPNSLPSGRNWQSTTGWSDEETFGGSSAALPKRAERQPARQPANEACGAVSELRSEKGHHRRFQKCPLKWSFGR